MSILDLNVKATSNLPLKPIKDPAVVGSFLYDGFVPGILKSVELYDVKYEKGEFKGVEGIKSLRFTFVNYPLTAEEPERVLIHDEKIVGSKKYEGERLVDMDVANVESLTVAMWKRIKHILEELKYSPNYKSIEKITKKDYEKYFNLPTSGTAQERSDAFNAFFGYICNFITGNGEEGKSMLVHERLKNAGYPMWLNIQADKQDSSRYALPQSVGSGMVEAARFNKEGKLLPVSRLERKPADILVVTARKGKSIPGTGQDSSSPNASVAAADILNKFNFD